MKVSDIQVDYIQHTGSDLAVVNAARVSFDKESNWEVSGYEEQYDCNSRSITYEPSLILSWKDRNLINYLAKHKHKSPFNHSFITLKVKAPLFCARQLVKHKFMPWNEVSRRYVDSEPEFYFPEILRAKAENVKQGSSDEAVKGSEEWLKSAQYHLKTVVLLYENMIKSGVCAEQARMILPQNMMTEWWWSGTLGAWADMLKLRMDPHTQYESRIVANKAYEIIKEHFPVSVEALLDNG